MSDNTLYVQPGCRRCLSAMVCLTTAKVEFSVVVVDKKMSFSKQFREVSPLGNVPVLKTSTTSVFGERALLRWVGRQNDSLYGTSPLQRANVDQWLEATWDLSTPLSQSLYQIYGSEQQPLDWKDVCKNTEEMVKSLGYVNNYLNGKKWLVGDSMTLADVSFVCNFENLFRYLLDGNQRKQLSHLSSYMTEKVNSEFFKCCMRTLTYNDEEFPFLKVDLEAEKKRKEAEKKKKAEELAKQKEIERLEREEDKPKKVEFPKAKIFIDDWKKKVVNEKDLDKKWEWIRANHEPEAYSFWKLDYDKLPDELKSFFISNNQLEGFFNRSESYRQHSFCFHALMGEENNYNLRGVWMWQGTEKLPLLDNNPSTEYYNYRKLDINNDDDFNLLKEYFSIKDSDVNTRKIEGEVIRAFVNYK